MKAARIEVSWELICELLGMPDGCELSAAYVSRTNTICLSLCHDSLPDTKLSEGQEPPFVEAVITRDRFNEPKLLRWVVTK